MRLLLVDDHAVVRAGFAALFSAEADIEIVGEAATAADAVAQCRRLRPDVVVLDLFLGQEDGFAFLAELGPLIDYTAVVVLSSYGGSANVLRALDAGARGYVLKHAEIAEVLRVIREVCGGHIALSVDLDISGLRREDRLTEAERRVLELVAEGHTNYQIAEQLSVSVVTVKTHVHHIMQKLRAQSRTDAVTKARRMGIVAG